MIIRRIRQHLGKRDWLAVGLDLVIAILGVFIGIQVSNWNQGRLDRQEGHEYRQRLIADLDANISDLQDRRTYFAAVRGHAVAALADLNGRAPRDDGAFLIHTFEATQINPRKIRRFTYDEVLARGASTWLGDARLREVIANYYVGIETTDVTFLSVTPYRDLVRSNMGNEAQLAVRRDCPERIYFAPDGTGLARLSGPCVLRMPSEQIAHDAAAVRAIPGIVPALNRLIADHDGKLSLIQPLIDHAKQLRGQILAADKG